MVLYTSTFSVGHPTKRYDFGSSISYGIYMPTTWNSNRLGKGRQQASYRAHAGQSWSSRMINHTMLMNHSST